MLDLLMIVCGSKEQRFFIQGCFLQPNLIVKINGKASLLK
jgi:hypothetical protein